MEEEQLINLLAEKACAYLRGDDINPDVGMGMSYHRSIQLAEEDVLIEAARWNSLAALQLQFTDTLREKVRTKVSEMRLSYLRF